MECVVSGVNHHVSETCVSLQHFANVQYTAMSLFHCSPSSHYLLLQPSHMGLSCHCLM